jgi:hypothetical protein
MQRQRTEDHDIVVHRFRSGYANGVYMDTFAVWLGTKRIAKRDTLEDAIWLARTLAEGLNRPAWLLDGSGYPLKPIA